MEGLINKIMDWITEANSFAYGYASTKYHVIVDDKDNVDRGGGRGRVWRPKLNISMVQKFP